MVEEVASKASLIIWKHMVNALLRYMHARHCLDFGLACIYGHVLNREETFDMVQVGMSVGTTIVEKGMFRGCALATLQSSSCSSRAGLWIPCEARSRLDSDLWYLLFSSGNALLLPQPRQYQGDAPYVSNAFICPVCIGQNSTKMKALPLGALCPMHIYICV